MSLAKLLAWLRPTPPAPESPKPTLEDYRAQDVRFAETIRSLGEAVLQTGKPQSARLKCLPGINLPGPAQAAAYDVLHRNGLDLDTYPHGFTENDAEETLTVFLIGGPRK